MRIIAVVFLSILVILLIPNLIRHVDDGYPASTLAGEILVILFFGAMALGLVIWKEKQGEIKRFDEEPKNYINPSYYRMKKDYKDRFRLWQGRQLTQLNWSINIMITINVATIVFWGQLYSDEKFSKQQLFCFSSDKIAVIVLIFSLIFGISSLWIRMNDFRNTLKVLNLRKLKLQVENGLSYYSQKKEDATYISDEIIKLRKKNDKLGSITHWLFKTQLVVYIVGLMLLILSIK